MSSWFGESRGLLLWLLLYVLFSSADGSIVNPSIELYMRAMDPGVSSGMVGLAVGLFPLGLMIGIVVICPLAERYLRAVLSVCLIILVASNALYSLAPHVSLIVISRFFAGFAVNAHSAPSLNMR